MIKSDFGRVEFKGSAPVLCADLGTAVDGLYRVFSEKYGKDEAKKLIMKAVESGFEEIEQLKERVEVMEAEAIAEFLEKLAKDMRGKEKKEDGSENSEQ